jgi:glycosyltransferase involved in cell wall biosynthesis
VIPICEIFPLRRQWKGGFTPTFLAFIKFNQIVRTWKPDVIVLNCDLPELFGALTFGRNCFVVLEHASVPWGHRPLLGRAVRQILDMRNTIWTAVSTHLNVWPTSKEPYAVLENPIVPISNIQAIASEGKIKRLIFIGRLSSEKRPELALEIAKFSGAELVMIGDGALLESLKRKATEESISAQFMGRVNNPWMGLSAGDVLIVTSSSEGDGLVVIEGLQHGIPMLLVDIPDFRRFNFPDENYCSDLEDFISRINSFSNNPSPLRVPSILAEKILSGRSLKVVGDKWEEFLDSL